MLTLSKPTEEAIRAFLAAQKRRNFSYPEVGASRRRAPDGYNVDHNRVRLGEGVDTFDRAADALRHWRMFEMSWLELCRPATPISAGTEVAVLASHGSFWSLNACRIVYRFEEYGVLRRSGFAYGTLRDHGAIGEERFSVEMNYGDGSVWYDILAFSRPGILARLAYPYTRSLQKRFAQDSMLSMKMAARDSIGSQPQSD